MTVTNWEKAKEEFSIEDVGNGGFCEAIHRIRHEKSCYNRFCDKCAKWLAEEYEEPILTESEKEYLAAIIRPFRNRVRYISKTTTRFIAKDCIFIAISEETGFELPLFETGTMYKRMEANIAYTLEELGL